MWWGDSKWKMILSQDAEDNQDTSLLVTRGINLAVQSPSQLPRKRQGPMFNPTQQVVLTMPDDTTMEFPFNLHNNLPTMMSVKDQGPVMAGLTRQDSELLMNPRAMLIKTEQARKKSCCFGIDDSDMLVFNGTRL